MEKMGLLATSVWLGLFLASASAPAEIHKKFPIDFSPVPPALTQQDTDEESEYFGRVAVLYSVLDSWEKGVGSQLTAILPWLQSDERIQKKWHHLVYDLNYRLISLRAGVNSPKLTSEASVIDPIKREIRINLQEGVYLDSDPGTLLVGAICDAEFHHRTTDYNRLRRSYTPQFQSALQTLFSKAGAPLAADAHDSNVALVASLWKAKRTALWQLAWYSKAVEKMPFIRRDTFSNELQSFQYDPKAWQQTQLERFLKQASPSQKALITAAWEHTLPAWYDLPN